MRRRCYAWFFVLGFSAAAGAGVPLWAMPTIMVEPYREDAQGGTFPLSQDPGNPTVFIWGEGATIRWWAFSTSAENGIPASQWHTRDSHGVTGDDPAEWCASGAVRFCCWPERERERGVYEFWVTATDDEGTDVSATYHIRVAFPPIIETRYHSTATEFQGKLARLERTAFNFGSLPHGVADSPEVHGCDNPSMFYGRGKLHFIFGDPDIYTGDPDHPSEGLNGAQAFTDRIVPEKGIDIAHHRNWILDPGRKTAKSLIGQAPGTWRANNIGGAVLPREGGFRTWFAVYDYGSGPRPSYQNYYQVSIVYNDDDFATPAVRDENLVLWDKDDAGNGPNNPDPYLGYPMRVFKDHLYMMIPREGGSDPVLLRCRRDELDARNLSRWHFLVGVDSAGRATWSKNPVTRGQISRAQFPTVDFSGDPAGIVNTVVWNPYLNRWIAVSALGLRIWEARQLWGPYQDLNQPPFFAVQQFAQNYAFFGHELLLGNNGEWLYHAQARSWQPLSYYGTYLQRLHLRDKLKMSVAPKSGVAGDTLAITLKNDTGLPAPAPSGVSVTVDGHPAVFSGQSGEEFHFTYQLTGAENGGAVGLVDVAGVMDVPMNEETSFRCQRDVALVVNQRNELGCAITSPAAGSAAGGWVPIQVTAAYTGTPEILEPHQPEVGILKTELRAAGGDEEVLDADAEPPYTLFLDSSRFPDGPREFKVIAYDTLDRRATAAISLNLQNGNPPAAEGNLLADGDMEVPGTASWQPLYGAFLAKIGGMDHRSGRQSLLVRSETPASSAGFRQVVSGLSGGERLRLTGWAKLKANYTASLRWLVTPQSGSAFPSQYASSFGSYRRVDFEFDNPPGNTRLTIDGLIRDTGTEGVVAGEGVTAVEAVVDDVALRPACHPLVQAPLAVQWQAAPPGDAVGVNWTPAPGPSADFFRIDRRPRGGPSADWTSAGEVRGWENAFTDSGCPGPVEAYEYRVVAIDEMGSTSLDIPPLGEVSDVAAGEPPLLVTGTVSNTVTVAEEPLAAAYNIYADSLGSWYSPTPEEGTLCAVATWTSNPGGTVSLPYTLPANSWIVVTASNACREGTAGKDSRQRPRETTGTWPACGAFP